MIDYNGQLAVVTGGASGRGYAIGEALAKEGAKVILTDIEQESLEASTASLAEQSLDVTCKVADVSNSTSMHELAKWCQSEHGSVHLLFNNAGVAPAELLPIWDTKPNDWQWVSHFRDDNVYPESNHCHFTLENDRGNYIRW